MAVRDLGVLVELLRYFEVQQGEIGLGALLKTVDVDGRFEVPRVLFLGICLDFYYFRWRDQLPKGQSLRPWFGRLPASMCRFHPKPHLSRRW